MSHFLAFDSFLIPLGASMEGVKTSMLAGLTSRGYQVIADGIGYDSVTASCAGAANIFEGGLSSVNDTAALPVTITLKCINAEEIVKYRMRSGSYYTWNTWSAWTLAWSDDGQTFTQVDARSAERLHIGEDREYVLASAPGAHRYWRWTITAVRNATYLSVGQIVPYTSSGKFICRDPTLILAPPASEVVGDALQREVVAFIVGSNTLQLRAGVQYFQDTPPVVGFSDATAGNVVASVSFGSQTVSIPAPAGTATANDNLWALFKALKESQLAEFKEWEWIYQPAPAQNASDTLDWIIGYRKSYAPLSEGGAGAGRSFSATNVTIKQLGLPVQVGTTPCWVPPLAWAGQGCSLPIDLVSGFIYYMQVNSRGFAIATKTNAGFYGPIHACWGDHAKALAQVPASPIPFLTSPIELMIGYDAAADGGTATATTATFWAMGNQGYNVFELRYRDGISYNGIAHPVAGSLIRSVFTNYHNCSLYSGLQNASFSLALSGIVDGAGGQGNVDDFQIHSMRDRGIKYVLLYLSNSQPGFAPLIDTDDWYRFRGSASNESLMLAADQVVSAVLQASHSATDTPAYLQLDSVDAFNSVGFVVIGSEVYAYTAKDIAAKRLTGISRAQYGSRARDHWAGERVNQALWFTIINGGALFCGYTKPA